MSNPKTTDDIPALKRLREASGERYGTHLNLFPYWNTQTGLGRSLPNNAKPTQYFIDLEAEEEPIPELECVFNYAGRLIEGFGCKPMDTAMERMTQIDNALTGLKDVTEAKCDEGPSQDARIEELEKEIADLKSNIDRNQVLYDEQEEAHEWTLWKLAKAQTDEDWLKGIVEKLAGGKA